ncbi:MAG: hypothetical protein NTY08_17175 [Proteobacteria bacterium]|nr:hypothetical protein [Pseudomonadota bacterium]
MNLYFRRYLLLLSVALTSCSYESKTKNETSSTTREGYTDGLATPVDISVSSVNSIAVSGDVISHAATAKKETTRTVSNKQLSCKLEAAEAYQARYTIVNGTMTQVNLDDSNMPNEVLTKIESTDPNSDLPGVYADGTSEFCFDNIKLTVKVTQTYTMTTVTTLMQCHFEQSRCSK